MNDDELKSLFDGIRQEIVGLRQDNGDIRQEIVGLRQDNGDIRQEIVGIRQEIVAVRQENDGAHVATRRHFDVALEANRHETQLIAESVALTREALDREATDIRAEVRRTASETQAMIKFSHAELDRRMRTLEDAVSDLQARVERLETSPH